MKTLSIQQPWAWAILHAGKDVENRRWRTTYRGPLLIHAGKSFDLDGFGELVHLRPDSHIPPSSHFPRSGIVGRVELVDIVHVDTLPSNPWAFGPWCWLLKHPQPLPLKLCKGQLVLFEIDYEALP